MESGIGVGSLHSPAVHRRYGLRSRYIFAALVVALLDLSFAATYWVVFRQAITFPRLLKGIAAGLLGHAALQGGASVAWLGALVHGSVAFLWTAIFLVLRIRWPAFRNALNGPRGVIAVGVPYGAFVWLAMDFVVLPLSRAAPTPITSSWFVICLVWHMIGVGPPMAVILRD
ncbi:MAG TPA: hypothetical protein VGL65_13730 [Gemmatimonadales bacterium]|jgi:hypothetical protein